VHPALLGHPRGQAQHGLSAGCGGCLRAASWSSRSRWLRPRCKGQQQAYVKLLAVSNKRGVIYGQGGAGSWRTLPARCAAMNHRAGRLSTWSRRPAARCTPTVRIGEIRTAKGDQFWSCVPGSEVYLRPGRAWGDVDAAGRQREMIRRTIKEHLDKEKRLRPLGIKVLSAVLHRRGGQVPPVRRRRQPGEGRLRPIFEEEYKRWAGTRTTRACSAEMDLSTPPTKCTTATSPSTRRKSAARR
jgi:type III restriction enzyme